MAKRPDLVDITSITNSSTIGAINQNWDRIQEAFDNTVSLDGSTPNAMNGDLDINGNALLNVGTIDAENLTLNGQQITDITSVPEWRSAWVTATGYVRNDLVKTAGNVYICLVSHTSGTFATDLTDNKWELMVPKGDSGAGTGDLLAANNLSDVADPATARANLSLGTVATENTVPVAKGGTGATDAATARVNLDLEVGVDVQAYNTRLNTLATVADPNADRLVFWDDSASDLAYLTPGNGLLVSGTTISSGYTWVSTTTTGASTFDFGSIPSGVSDIVCLFTISLTTKSDNPIIRIGSGGSPATTGYSGNSFFSSNGALPSVAAYTSAFVLPVSQDTISGSMRILRVGGTELWFASSQARYSESGQPSFTSLSSLITLGGALDIVRLTRTGASNYNGGTFAVGYK